MIVIPFFVTGFLIFGLTSEVSEIGISTNSYFEYSARQLIRLQYHFIQYSPSMLVPVPKHLSFTGLKISSLLHVSEIYLPQYITFSLTQLISPSTRSVSIEIQSSFLPSPNESPSFLDPWSTMFCTFWRMERRMCSPLPSTKLSSRSPTTEVPSTANIRQSSDMLRTCLSSWREVRNRSGPYLREWYDTFDVIVCFLYFWCFELLKARNTIISNRLSSEKTVGKGSSICKG